MQLQLSYDASHVLEGVLEGMMIDRGAPWCFWLLESTRDVVKYGGSFCIEQINGKTPQRKQKQWTWKNEPWRARV